MATTTLEKIVQEPVKTEDSKLTITMPSEKLAVGSHTFELVVEDNAGNKSTPATVTLIVIDTQAPTAVPRVTDIRGRVLLRNRIAHGASFILDGGRSVDSGGGSIVSYTWTLVQEQ